MKKIALSLIVVVLIVIVSPVWLGWFLRDMEPGTYTDLELVIEEPEVNAYDELLKVKTEYADPQDVLTLASNADAYLDPSLLSDLNYADVKYDLDGLSYVVALAIERAKDFAEEGEEDLAKEELRKALVVVQMAQDSPGLLTQKLIVMKEKTALLNAILDMALQMDLSDFQDNETGYANALKVEFAMQQNLIKELDPFSDVKSDLRFESSYYFHPNSTIDYFAERARLGIATYTAECEEVTEGLEDFVVPEFLFFTKNAIGKMIISEINPRLAGNQMRCDVESLLLQSSL